MKAITVLLAVLVLMPSNLLASTPFDKGRVHLSLSGGSVRSGDDYGIAIGGGLGYMVYDGVMLGLDGQYWTGIKPQVLTLSPQARYWLNLGGGFFPFVGTFFSHSFVEGFEDWQSYGFRTGVAMLSGRGLFITAGWAFEKYIKGNPNKEWKNYPEIAFGISF